jgi:hypothetical protein
VKYFSNIILIVVVSALFAVGLNHYLQRPIHKEPLLSIDAAQYSLNELEEKMKQTPYAYSDRSYFVDSVIDRALLLQEAQRQRLDQEPAFAKAMQDFLEQSLVRNVIDRFYAKLQPQITTDQIDHYLHWQNKSFNLQFFYYADMPQAEADQPLSERIIDSKYSILPPVIRAAISAVAIGEVTLPLQYNNELVRVKVLGENTSTDSGARSLDRQEIETKLIQEQKSAMMDQWLQQLREQATVTGSERLERWKNDKD